MNILGINSYFEHPAVALVCDGELVFAMEDERATRIKHGKQYTPYKTYVPFDAVYAALEAAHLKPSDLHEVAYSYSRWDHLRGLWGCVRGERLSSIYDELAAFGAVSHVRRALSSAYEMPHKFRGRMDSRDFTKVPFREWNHHLSHAASAFFCSGFNEALVVVSDGSGESACTSIYVGQGSSLRQVDSMKIPNSLGFFYSFVTEHLGFQPFSDEFKVMGLAAYGEPSYVEEFGQILKLLPNGRYSVDIQKLKNLSQLLGPPRSYDEPLAERHRNIARSAQACLENALVWIIQHHLKECGMSRLCVAGGTFLNCVANGRIASLSEVEDMFVQPAAHDAGTAIGAAALSAIRRGAPPQLKFSSMALGNEYNRDAIKKELSGSQVQHREFSDAELVGRLADRLSEEAIGAVFRGRMEFGPRALGKRSVLASPRQQATRDRLNRIKGREGFRPVAPIVKANKAESYFDGFANEYMLFTTRVRESARSVIPAAVHADGSARVQLVTESSDPFLYDVLDAFEVRTGVPMLINTSFNSRGKPIVETPQDALACFLTSELDFLVLGNFWVERYGNELVAS